MSANGSTGFTRGSLGELKHLTKLICYAYLDPDVWQKHTKITVYYDFDGSRPRLINVSPRIEYGDNFRNLLNLAVAQNTPSKCIGICLENAPTGHDFVEAHRLLIEDEAIGNYAQKI